jgi:hypothetical protein
MGEKNNSRADLAIWAFAFGYFAAYLPYSALTKALSGGSMTGARIPGLTLLPTTTMASLVAMFITISLLRWWKFATHRQILGVSVPTPTKWTLFSGVCTAAIIGTTTMAYTFAGASIVLMMLFMRGGVLVIAPIVDAISRRHVRWFSWTALGLSFVAVLIPNIEGGALVPTLAAGLDLALYLFGYFVRLRAMSHLAKSNDPNAMRRYFVEEQMVATPVIVGFLAVVALIGGVPQFDQIRHGFTEMFSRGTLTVEIVIGVLSQGTGIFGALVLLDSRENSFCVPVNRASSVLAGILASVLLPFFGVASDVHGLELFGAALLIGAILVLSIPPMIEKRRRAAEAAAALAAPHP